MAKSCMEASNENTSKPTISNIKTPHKASNKKHSDNKLYLELKYIKNDIFEKCKNSKMTQKHLKAKHPKNSKIQIRRSQIKKFSK